MVMACNYEVVYEGRASSSASNARRLIIKEDGTLMIHEGPGVKPISWGFGIQIENAISMLITPCETQNS